MAGTPGPPTCQSIRPDTQKLQADCVRCVSPLQNMDGVMPCPTCNDHAGKLGGRLFSAVHGFAVDSDKVLIECPGATLYHPGTNEVALGVRFIDNDNPSRGYKIVGKTVFGPKHVRRRWVRKEDAHLIRRCQSCQDYTVRMKRKEGADLYIPSRKGPEMHCLRPHA